MKKEKYLIKLKKKKIKKILFTKRKFIMKKIKDEKEKKEERITIRNHIDTNKFLFKDFEKVKKNNICDLLIFSEFFQKVEDFDEEIIKENFEKIEYEFSPKKIFFNLLSFLEYDHKLDITDAIYDIIIYISFYFKLKMNENNINNFFFGLKKIKNPFLFCGKLSYVLNNFCQDNKKYFFLFENQIWNYFYSVLKEKISEENFFMVLKNLKMIIKANRKIDNYSGENLKNIFSLLIDFYLRKKNFIEIIPILSQINEKEIDKNFDKFLNLMFEIFSKEEENYIHDENCLIIIEKIFKFEDNNFENIFLLNEKGIINKIIVLTKKKYDNSDLCFNILDLILNKFGYSFFENLNIDFLDLFLINLLNFENKVMNSFFNFCLNFYGFFSYQNVNIQKLIVFIEVLIQKYIYFFKEKIIITMILRKIFELYHENNYSDFLNFFKKIYKNKKFLMFFEGNKRFVNLDLSEILEDIN